MTQTGGASFSLASESPSFTSYSSENIADIAARVLKELNLSHDDPFDDDFYSSDAFNAAVDDTPQPPLVNDTARPQNDNQTNDSDDDDKDIEEHSDDESEFEFAILTGEDNSSPISADEMFDNGQIKPMFPVFNTDLIYGYTSDLPQTTVRLPLRKLLEERESGSGNGAASCSSSEADDLEGVPPGTYCVWTPKKKEEELMMKKKSKSTGSSRRWRFRDLLHRSNSDGKDTFVFLAPSIHHKTMGIGGSGGVGGSSGGGDGKRREKVVTVGGKKKGGAVASKNKTYLPYRQDLVGFFANVNGISRTVRPF
ncbi:hypothetical protein SOVF_010220 [Spinacia oleracea]|uniref:Uncharacterized protein n=1 Tax=Spinacia oleracea TaxID=3562 RepID=A0A9R0IIJ4_SPIOL|nr:uncharacterized protein LOC110789454 [Spinacia oleracea]KNA25044.1 hypothetical protein SOVF_010220 [Spinacia oleracea]